MGRLEGIVGDGGIAVGSSISLADVLIYNAFAECLTEVEAPEKEAWQRAPFNDAARMEAALAAHPKLKAICDADEEDADVLEGAWSMKFEETKRE